MKKYSRKVDDIHNMNVVKVPKDRRTSSSRKEIILEIIQGKFPELKGMDL